MTNSGRPHAKAQESTAVGSAERLARLVRAFNELPDSTKIVLLTLCPEFYFASSFLVRRVEAEQRVYSR